MTLQQLKIKANTKLQEFWDALVVRQEAYRLKHDNYFQLLITIDVDGVSTTAPQGAFIRLTFQLP